MHPATAEVPPAAGQLEPARGRFDTLWFFLGSLLLYGLLRQHTFYGTDAHGLLAGSLKGDLVHPFHFAYLLLLGASREVTLWLGGTIYDAGTWLSAIGTAAGVAAAHAAGRCLGLPRADAAIAAALVATAPAIVFFATVVEIHGAHLGLCGPMFLAIAAFGLRPDWTRGVWLGAATGLGYLGHATGALLPVLALPLAAVLAVQRGADGRRVALGLLPAPFLHALIVVVVPRLMGFQGGEHAPEDAVRTLQDAMAGDELWSVLLPWRAAWQDWLRPFAPLSLLALLGLSYPRARALVAAFAPALAALLAVTAVLMDHGTERGAYLLPLAWPAALAAVAALPRRVLLPSVAVALALAVSDVVAHDRGEDRAFADGYREVLGARRTWVLAGTHREVAALTIWLPDATWDQPFGWLGGSADEMAAGLPAIDAWLRATTAGGTEVWVTSGAVTVLSDLAWTKGRPAGPMLLDHLRGTCSWEEHRAQTFTAWRVRPK